MPPSAFRLMFIGSREELTRLKSAMPNGAGDFEVQLTEPDGEGEIAASDLATSNPEIAVIAPTVAAPLPIARKLRELSPSLQIVFVLPPERIERFRAGLPFVPHLASAWTASTSLDDFALGSLIADAAQASRERAATATVFGRINRRLAAGKAAPEQVRRSQLALSEQYLATILTQSPDAFLAAGLNGAVIAHNDAASRLFGPALEAEGPRKVAELFPENERLRIEEALASAGNGDTVRYLGVQLQHPSKIDVELSLAPIRDESGTVATISVTGRNVTERKEAEQRQRLLINELNHRVKNTLAIVQALAQQSFKEKASPSEERRAFEARLATLSAAHDLLTSQSWKSASLGEVVEASMDAACGPDQGRREIGGPHIPLTPQTAVAFAMAVHELCTNAIKYGALSNDIGTLQVSWGIDGSPPEERLTFEWIERGGPPVERPTSRGFGTRMIERGLGAELNAKIRLDFESEGLSCLIDAPLSGVRAPDA